ncbi:MAG: LamG domain-containing protein [Patescibacteria group bacterium]
MKRFFFFAITSTFLFGIFFISGHTTEAFTLTRGGNQLGLVGWWTFDGSTMGANVGDSSGLSNNGFIFGQVATTTVSGKVGQAIFFDNVDDYVYVPYNASFDVGTGDFTVSAWVKTVGPQGSGQSALGTIFSKDDGSGNGIVLNNNGPNGSNYVRALVGGVSVTGSVSVNDNQWHHVVLTRRSGVICVYIDGVLSASASAPGDTNQTNRDIYLGLEFTGPWLGAGAQDDTRFYNRALSDAEIRALYNTGVGSKLGAITHAAASSYLLGWWTLDGKSTPWSSPTAGITLDSSGAGNNGTLTGMNSSSATVLGKVGQALAFDGVNDEVALPNITSLTDNVSFSTWAYWLDTAGAQIPLSFGNTGTNGYGFIIGDNSCGSGSKLTIYLGGVSCDALSGSTYTMPTGQWVHLIGVRDATTWKLYVNGALQQTGGTVSPNTPTTLSSIGNGTFHGYLDDVRIFNKALTAAEVGAQYNQEKGAKQNVTPTTALTSGLVGWWTFDGKNLQQNVKDTSGQGIDGHLVNFTATTTALGKLGQAFKFNGSGYVTVPANSIYDVGTGDFTVAFWYKSAGAAAIECPFSKDDGSGTGIVMYFRADGYVQTFVGNGIPTSWFASTINDNVWHHFVFRRTSGIIELFEDRVSLGADTRSASIGTQPLRWGIEDGFDWPAVGTMDDARYYNRAISDTEIKQLYNLAR